MTDRISDPSRRLCGRRLAIAGGTLTLLVATTCGADAPRDVVLWSANDQWVKIVPQDDPAASPNEHPAQLAPEAISNSLAALQVRVVDEDAGTETLRSVFSREELQNLAPRVASGLAQASPRQDVTFSTVGSHPLSNGGFVKGVDVNAGRVFYDSGKLNVIFGELQSSYRKKNLYGQRTEDFTPRRQGSRDKVAEQKLSLAPHPGVQEIREDWVAIDSKVAASQPVPAPQPGETKAQQPGSAPAVPAPDAAKAAAGSAAEKSSADVEQRLRTLKDLKDKGLISEEAYRAKMQEVLSEL
jgi:hypothetical protein